MSFDSLRRVAAAAGLASATAAAGAQIPAEVTVPLGDSYPAANCPSYGYGGVGYDGGVVYDAHGGMYVGAYGYGTTPARNPVERIPVQYLRYYPAVWYGLPGSTLPVVAPQVHMPTDTTQLGFYYQRVPTWAPVPGMVPPPPNPSAYHSYMPMGYAAEGGIVAGTEYTGTTANGAVTNERVISVRPLTNGSKGGAHSATGTTPTAPNVVPVPPGPNGGSELPLQPPP
ncbi:MAG TPA: hypothetical protein VF170_12305, partial [Planctomycetaceae bacterium]